MTDWLKAVSDWLAAYPEWLGLALFIVACSECLAIVGLIMPGTVLLFAIAVMAGSGALGLGQTLLLGFVGGLLGDFLSYGLGFRFKHSIRRLPGLRTHPQWLDSTERYFERFGAISLLIGRYIGPLRPLLPMVAGMFRMPLWRFTLVSLLAAAGWSIAYLLPGWMAGAALRLPLPQGFWQDAAFLLVPLALLVLASVYSSQRQWRYSSALSAALGLLAVCALLLGFAHLQSFDRGLMALVQANRSAALDPWAVLITCFGDTRCQVVLGALLLGILLWLRQFRAGIFVTSALVGTALLTEALKHLLVRARPDVLLHPLSGFSLPSGHSAASFAFFLTLAVLAGRSQPPRWRLVWLLLGSLPAFAIVCSRVYLGAHWPTDVLTGSLLGAALCALSLYAVQRKEPLPALRARFWQLLLPAVVLWFSAYAFFVFPGALLRYAY